MFRTPLRLIVFIVITSLIAGCSSMKCEHYAGIKEPITTKDLKSETVWQFEDIVFHVKRIDDSNAIATTLEWDETQKKHISRTSEIIIGKLDEHYFMSIKKEKSDLYTILKFIPSISGELSLFTIDDKTIEKHIEEGKVKGTKQGNEFTLELTKEELDKYILENVKTLFDYTQTGMVEPLVGFDVKNK